MLSRILDRLSFLLSWQSRPQVEQKRIAYLALVLSILFPLFIWSWISSAASQAQAKIDQLVSSYEKALPLAEAVIAQDSGQEPAHKNISALAAAQRLTQETSLETKLASIRPSRDQSGLERVQLYLENLNLVELLHFFSSLQQDSSLYAVSCDLSRRMDNPRRMDAKLILGR